MNGYNGFKILKIHKYISQNVNQFYIVWTFYKGLYRQTLYEKHQHLVAQAVEKISTALFSLNFPLSHFIIEKAY